MDMLKNQYISTAELADLLRVKPNTIERWRTGRECPFTWIKVCGRVLYDRNEVMEYLENKKRNSVNSITKECKND